MLSNFGRLHLVETTDDEQHSERIHTLDGFRAVSLGADAAFVQATRSSDDRSEVLSASVHGGHLFRVVDGRSGAPLADLQVPSVEPPWSVDWHSGAKVLTIVEHGVESPSRWRFFRLVKGTFREVRVAGEGGVAAAGFFLSRRASPAALLRSDAEGSIVKRRTLNCEPGSLFLSPEEHTVVFGCAGTVRVVDVETLQEQRACGLIPPRTSEGESVGLSGVFADNARFQMDLDSAGHHEMLDLATCARGPDATPSHETAAVLACDGLLEMAPSGTRALCLGKTSARTVALDGREIYRVF